MTIVHPLTTTYPDRVRVTPKMFTRYGGIGRRSEVPTGINMVRVGPSLDDVRSILEYDPAETPLSYAGPVSVRALFSGSYASQSYWNESHPFLWARWPGGSSAVGIRVGIVSDGSVDLLVGRMDSSTYINGYTARGSGGSRVAEKIHGLRLDVRTVHREVHCKVFVADDVTSWPVTWSPFFLYIAQEGRMNPTAGRNLLNLGASSIAPGTAYDVTDPSDLLVGAAGWGAGGQSGAHARKHCFVGNFHLLK